MGTRRAAAILALSSSVLPGCLSSQDLISRGAGLTALLWEEHYNRPVEATLDVRIDGFYTQPTGLYCPYRLVRPAPESVPAWTPVTSEAGALEIDVPPETVRSLADELAAEPETILSVRGSLELRPGEPETPARMVVAVTRQVGRLGATRTDAVFLNGTWRVSGRSGDLHGVPPLAAGVRPVPLRIRCSMEANDTGLLILLTPLTFTVDAAVATATACALMFCQGGGGGGTSVRQDAGRGGADARSR